MMVGSRSHLRFIGYDAITQNYRFFDSSTSEIAPEVDLAFQRPAAKSYGVES